MRLVSTLSSPRVLLPEEVDRLAEALAERCRSSCFICTERTQGERKVP